MGAFFVRFVTFTSTLVVLCNSYSAIYRLGYHDVLIRSSTCIQTDKELLKLNYTFTRNCYLFHSSSLSVCLGECSWPHHLMNLLEPSMHSVPVQN